jgi:hypothetical protein
LRRARRQLRTQRIFMREDRGRLSQRTLRSRTRGHRRTAGPCAYSARYRRMRDTVHCGLRGRNWPLVQFVTPPLQGRAHPVMRACVRRLRLRLSPGRDHPMAVELSGSWFARAEVEARRGQVQIAR